MGLGPILLTDARMDSESASSVWVLSGARVDADHAETLGNAAPGLTQLLVGQHPKNEKRTAAIISEPIDFLMASSFSLKDESPISVGIEYLGGEKSLLWDVLDI
jgi:hypothetical protein